MMDTEGTAPPVKPATGAEKAKRPHAHFDAPIDVVDDQALSRTQKATALDSLEQDARQMAAASSEGMGGGEPTDLRAVLTAQATLALPPKESAYEMVRRDLASRMDSSPPGAIHAALGQALAALDVLAHLSQPILDAATVTDAAERADEAMRERLDP